MKKVLILSVIIAFACCLNCPAEACRADQENPGYDFGTSCTDFNSNPRLFENHYRDQGDKGGATGLAGFHGGTGWDQGPNGSQEWHNNSHDGTCPNAAPVPAGIILLGSGLLGLLGLRQKMK